MVFQAALQYEEVVAVTSDHRYMRSGFAFLTDGMETQGILLALTSKCVYGIGLWLALSFKERVSTDGQSINFCLEKAPELWHTKSVEWHSKIW